MNDTHIAFTTAAACQVLSLVLILLSGIAPAHAQQQCDQKQALDMLTRIGTFKQQFMRSGSAQLEKIKELAMRSAHGGTLIGQKKYSEACVHYQSIADDFDFDLSQSKAMSVDEITAYQNNTEEGCDIRSIVQRSNSATVKIASLKGQVAAETNADFDRRSEDLGMLMRTDLAQACQVSKELEADLQKHADG